MSKSYDFLKEGSMDCGFVQEVNHEQVLADPKLMERLHKFAQDIRTIAPKSDDFLYFSIIFLKAAESALIDEKGELKKIGNEKAWGYFDENWKWHGNIKCHKNNNGDIFPESELRKHAKDWIGLPLCRDHESSSVDGIRGIILDTHYDEKLKQVVGLCALDRINYPDLARKVETGVVRYGSMGTAVETAICTECSQKAKTAKEYCIHITNKTAWGEINVGLKPIEYSLVVQPAEPGAVLLRCIASLESYRKEFIDYGIENTDDLLGQLSAEQAQHLETIMKTACNDNGCSIPQRRKIVTSFLKQQGFLKSSVDLAGLGTQSIADIIKSLSQLDSLSADLGIKKEDLANALLNSIGNSQSLPAGETLTSGEDASGGESIRVLDDAGTVDSGSATAPMVGGANTEENVFQPGGVGPESYTLPPARATWNDTFNPRKQLKNIMEDIMNEARLRKRAEARRKIAYHQGGAAGVEPTGTYKDQGKEQNRIREKDDKQMHQDFGAHDSETGVLKEDMPIKEKHSRAELEERQMKRQAYYQGGAAGVEPTGTYKDQGKEQNRIREKDDKQMHQDFGAHDAETGILKEDKAVKEKHSRATYQGPALRTKFSTKRKLDGSVDKQASMFEVFAGNDRVIASTAGQIFGQKLDDNWEWLATSEYGKEVVSQIREHGLRHVAGLLKSAQALPPMDAAPAGAPPADMPPMGGDMPPMPGAEAGPGPEADAPESEASPQQEVDEVLISLEDSVKRLGELIPKLGGGTDKVEIHMEGEDKGGEEPVQAAFSKKVLDQLKKVYAEMDQSADELAQISETYDCAEKLMPTQKNDLNRIAREALHDSAEISGEAEALMRVAQILADSMVKTAEYVEKVEAPRVVREKVTASKAVTKEAVQTADNEIVAKTMEYRKARRELLLKKAEERLVAERRLRREAMTQDADAADKSEDMAADAATDPAIDAAADAVADAVNDAKDSASPAKDAISDAKDAASDVAEDKKMEEYADDAATDQVSKAEDTVEHSAKDSAEDAANDATVTNIAAAASKLKSKLSETLLTKKADEEREAYRLKLRRAYDVSMEMQRKGLLSTGKVALDQQVDEIMQFDDKAFESYKRSIANAKMAPEVKIASDISGINVGSQEQSIETKEKVGSAAQNLASMWD